MDGGQDAAGMGIETVFGFVVSDPVDGRPDGFLDIDIGGLGADFAADYDQARGAESLAGHFGSGVLAKEFVQDGIGNLVGHFIRMAFGNGFGSKQVVHLRSSFA